MVVFVLCIFPLLVHFDVAHFRWCVFPLLVLKENPELFFGYVPLLVPFGVAHLRWCGFPCSC